MGLKYINEILLMMQLESQIIQEEQLKETVLRFQNAQEQGYYVFEDWKTLHSHLFQMNESLLTSTVINGWRILKLINFGDDFVPTGLVYDMLSTVMDVQQTSEEAQFLLKRIFFKFIEFNNKLLSEKEKEELAFFRVVRSIVEGYRKTILHNLTSHAEKQEAPEGMLRRNEQLYRLHNVLTYKKNLEALKKIQHQFKSCTFEPLINPKSEITQSRYLEPRAEPSQPHESKHGSVKHIVINEDEEYQGQMGSFKASPVPLYPQASPNGLSEHLVRMQKSRQIKQINALKPYHTHNTMGSSTVSEFTIGQREQARKENALSELKILFMIKVEVGKRIYRVKVRQSMGVEQVVKNIELMVGFKDSSLQQIVKQYFLNYERREQVNQSIRQ